MLLHKVLIRNYHWLKFYIGAILKRLKMLFSLKTTSGTDMNIYR